MNSNSSNIILNLRTEDQKENAFFLMVLLANSHIGNIRHNLTDIEHQIFSFHIKDVFKKIYHHENKWAETYMNISKHLTQTDDIDGNVYGAIRFGLNGISKQDARQLCMLFEFSCLYLEGTINRGSSQMSFEAKEIFKSIMLECEIL